MVGKKFLPTFDEVIDAIESAPQDPASYEPMTFTAKRAPSRPKVTLEKKGAEGGLWYWYYPGQFTVTEARTA